MLRYVGQEDFMDQEEYNDDFATPVLAGKALLRRSD